MIYGHDKTIHRTELLNIEVDKDGNVVSVWFRCMALPFSVSIADDNRAESMRRMYTEDNIKPLVAVEVKDE